MPLCRAASGERATSRAMGPSTTQGTSKAPAFQASTSPAASTVAGILGFTCSLAVMAATLGAS